MALHIADLASQGSTVAITALCDPVYNFYLLKVTSHGVEELGEDFTDDYLINERARDGQAIEVVKSRHPVKSCPVRELNAKRCLTALHRARVKRKNSPSYFAVPKCMFVNICSLSKTKNRVRAPVALEADMRNNDIDVRIVSDSFKTGTTRRGG